MGSKGYSHEVKTCGRVQETIPWGQGRTGVAIHPGSNGKPLSVSIQMSPVQLLTQHLATRLPPSARVLLEVVAYQCRNVTFRAG